MNRPLHTTAALIWCGIFLLIGCDGATLEKTQKQLVVLQTENETLHRQNSDLQRRYADLEADRDNLSTQFNEIQQWTRELVSAVGPSLWSAGAYERPIPIRFYQKASPAQLVEALNSHFQSLQMPRIVLLKIDAQTAVVAVEPGDQLTETMGTTGAQGYLSAVTYTLCSLDSITCVDFKFKPGSHAVPGPYCR